MSKINEVVWKLAAKGLLWISFISGMCRMKNFFEIRRKEQFDLLQFGELSHKSDITHCNFNTKLVLRKPSGSQLVT